MDETYVTNGLGKIVSSSMKIEINANCLEIKERSLLTIINLPSWSCRAERVLKQGNTRWASIMPDSPIITATQSYTASVYIRPHVIDADIFELSHPGSPRTILF